MDLFINIDLPIIKKIQSNLAPLMLNQKPLKQYFLAKQKIEKTNPIFKPDVTPCMPLIQNMCLNDG